MSGLVIVGASYAGVQAAISAREAGYRLPISIVSEEDRLPYQRPPLSKGFLLGSVAEDGLVIRNETFFRTQAIEIVQGRVNTINRCGKTIETANGRVLGYDSLVLATGSRARKLTIPGAELPHIHYLRQFGDARLLREKLMQAHEIVVIGGGFIGLEFASAAAKLGKQVTIVEAAPRLLERAVSPAVSGFLLDLHRAHGVRVVLNGAIGTFDRDGDDRCVAVTAQGERLPADLVVVGIGGIPNQELAQAADITCTNGIVTNEFGQSSDPNIWAAGDCTNHPNHFAGLRLRLESVQNATDQGRSVGSTIAGSPLPYTSVPRFWSDQYEAKLQIVGLVSRDDEQVVRGSIEDGRFSIFSFQHGRLLSVESVNRPGEQMISRRLMADAVSPTRLQVEDSAFDLRHLVSAP